MISPSAEHVLAIVCDSHGVVREVLRNDLQIPSLKIDTRFSDTVDAASAGKANAFIGTINARLAAFDWEMNVELNDAVASVFFAGGRNKDGILIVGSQSRNAIARYFDEMMLMNNEQANELRALIKDDLSAKWPQRGDEACYDDMTRLTNELTTVQRELAKKNVALEAAVTELESFSYSVSHDLRAPLRAINFLSAVLVEDHGPALPAEARQHLDTIQQKAQQMGAMIEALLNLSKQSKAPLKKMRINLRAVAEKMVADMRPDLNGRNVEVIYGDLPEPEGDPVLLPQVISNLLSNAFKYTRHRENAVVEFGSTTDNAGSVTYFVSDNGIGYGEKVSHRLFNIFDRLHPDQDFEGTGVGLALAKRIVERHSGNIWAESTEGAGSTFYFTL